MKKIFFYVLMFVMMGHINAQGGLYSEWTEEYPIGIPKDVIQSETRYKWYKEDIIDIEYLKKEDIYNKLVDYNDFKTYESEELLDEPIKFNDRVIKREYKDYKFEKNTINYIVLTNNNKSDVVGISEIVVFDNKKAIKLNVSVDKKYSDLLDNNKDKSHILNYKESIYINLNEECEADDVRIFIYYNSSVYNNKLSISYNAHKDYPLYVREASLSYCSLCELYNMGIKDMNETNRVYKLNVYKYIDKYYKTYKIKKEYKEEYYSKLDGYKKDESTKKTFYRYLKYKLIVYLPDGTISDNFDNCSKSLCTFKLEEIIYPKVEEKQEKEIIPPKTGDSFNIIILIISFIVLSSIIIYVIKDKCRKMSYE